MIKASMAARCFPPNISQLRMRQRHDGSDDVVTSLWIDAALLNVTDCLFCAATIVNADTTLAAAWQ